MSDRVEATTIRPTRRDEPVALRQLRLRALAQAPDAFASALADESAYELGHWEQLVAGADGRTVVVAEAPDGRLVGMAGGRWVDRGSGVAGLWGLWVEPGVRRSGTGRGLVEGVRAWAAAHGARFLRLGVFSAGGEAALAFYRTLGFVDLDDPVPMRSNPSRLVVVMVRPV
jgi:GNAT superfamily N-acetyltransferase